MIIALMLLGLWWGSDSKLSLIHIYFRGGAGYGSIDPVSSKERPIGKGRRS